MMNLLDTTVTMDYVGFENGPMEKVFMVGGVLMICGVAYFIGATAYKLYRVRKERRDAKKDK